MNKIPTKEEINNIIDVRFSNEIHEKLRNAKVAVAGLGGLGSNIAIMLARSGIENIHIVDFDKVDLSNLTLLSKIKDLRVTNAAGQNVSKEYTNIEVTWEEPRLNDNIETIQILHYSTVRNCWEVFAPKSVDYDKKTITAFFYDLSPVGVLYKVKDAESVDEQLVVTSVKSVNVYIVIIVFGLVMALYAFYKAREQKEVE